MKFPKTYFFCGIGGSGMSAIAQLFNSLGYTVFGSDRNFDRGINKVTFKQLLAQGIHLFKQDGSGVVDAVDEFVISTAIEPSNRDVKRALELGISISKRAECLANYVNSTSGIAVAGTSGKSTVTAMIGHILRYAGRNPTILNGGKMIENTTPTLLGNAVIGSEEIVVYEADESDGSLSLYKPDIAIVNNISKDHNKSIEELSNLFGQYLQNAVKAVAVNIHCIPHLPSKSLRSSCYTFGTNDEGATIETKNILMSEKNVSFTINNVEFRMGIPGRHNVMNALAAITTSKILGISLEKSAQALQGFLGVARRMQIVGENNGIRVIDDFAHNPDKIFATLSTLKSRGRLLIAYQPHGFSSTLFLKDELIAVFSDTLDSEDLLAMPEIYYAGGTVKKSISSKSLITAIKKRGIKARFFPDRNTIKKWFLQKAQPGDTIVIMGARDDTLSDFANHILQGLKKTKILRENMDDTKQT